MYFRSILLFAIIGFVTVSCADHNDKLYSYKHAHGFKQAGTQTAPIAAPNKDAPAGDVGQIVPGSTPQKDAPIIDQGFGPVATDQGAEAPQNDKPSASKPTGTLNPAAVPVSQKEDPQKGTEAKPSSTEQDGQANNGDKIPLLGELWFNGKEEEEEEEEENENGLNSELATENGSDGHKQIIENGNDGEVPQRGQILPAISGRPAAAPVANKRLNQSTKKHTRKHATKHSTKHGSRKHTKKHARHAKKHEKE